MSVSQHHHHAHSEFYEFLDSYHGQLNHNGYLFVPEKFIANKPKPAIVVIQYMKKELELVGPEAH